LDHTQNVIAVLLANMITHAIRYLHGTKYIRKHFK